MRTWVNIVQAGMSGLTLPQFYAMTVNEISELLFELLEYKKEELARTNAANPITS